MADLVKQLFSKADIDAIEQAVKQAEAHTSGEILVRIVSRSYPWRRERLIISGLLSVLVMLASLWWTREHNWGTYYDYTAALIWGLGAFALLYLVLSEKVLKMGGRRQRFVLIQAEKELARMPATSGATGVLIYVSLEEHWAVVLAEKMIYEKIAHDFWEKPLKEIISGIKKNEHAEGICNAVNLIGRELAPVLPRLSDDKDELPDRPHMG